MTKKLNAHLGPLEIEAKALEEGVSFAWDANIRDLVVKSDSHIDTFKGHGTTPVQCLLKMSLRDTEQVVRVQTHTHFQH